MLDVTSGSHVLYVGERRSAASPAVRVAARAGTGGAPRELPDAAGLRQPSAAARPGRA